MKLDLIQVGNVIFPASSIEYLTQGQSLHEGRLVFTVRMAMKGYGEIVLHETEATRFLAVLKQNCTVCQILGPS